MASDASRSSSSGRAPAPDDLALRCDFGQTRSLSTADVSAMVQQTESDGSLVPAAPDRRSSETPVATEPKYSLVAPIDKGGMGAVYRAHDRDLRRDVALKTPHDDRARSRLRLIEEAQLTGQLEHPNIVPIHELGVNKDGRHFFTMKLIEGRTLKDIFAELRASKNQGKSVPHEYSRHSLLIAFMNVCNAIAFAHSKGVLHRDLKPANIMIGKFGEVLVVDWGLAKLKSSHRADVPENVTNNTPAEQFRSRRIESIREESGIELTIEGDGQRHARVYGARAGPMQNR
jgi:predicted Ser/Thr protein kinase